MSKSEVKRKDIQIKATEDQLPVAALNFEADAGDSFQVTQEDTAIPFLKILQPLSPECLAGDAYIEGAKAGLFINTVTKEVLGASVTVIPAGYKRIYNTWAPREKGGGFKGALEVHSDIVGAAKSTNKKDDKGNLVINDQGDYIRDTRNMFIVLVSNGRAIPMLCSLAGTQIKKAKNWMGQITNLLIPNKDGKSFNPPPYSHIYTLSTVVEKNDKGQWYGLKVELKEPVSSVELYETAKQFYALVKEDKVVVSEPSTDAKEEGF